MGWYGSIEGAGVRGQLERCLRVGLQRGPSGLKPNSKFGDLTQALEGRLHPSVSPTFNESASLRSAGRANAPVPTRAPVPHISYLAKK
jgi:hypothetical protein